jgi:hypothetical protein
MAAELPDPKEHRQNVHSSARGSAAWRRLEGQEDRSWEKVAAALGLFG